MFNATHMPRAARQAAKANGLAAVAEYEIVSHYHMISEDDDNAKLVVIRAYSPGSKSVDITAGDIWYFETVAQDAKMARIAKRHGGSRPGAGHPTLSPTETTVKIECRLPASLAEKATDLGNGNRSAGIRRAIEQA